MPPSSAAMLLTVVMACRLECTALLLAGTVWEPSSTPKVWTVVPTGLRTSHVGTWESVASRNNGSARRTRPALPRRVWRHGSQLSCVSSGVNRVDSHCGSLYPYNGYGSREDAVVESAAGRCGCGVGAAVRQREDAVRVEWKRDW